MRTVLFSLLLLACSGTPGNPDGGNGGGSNGGGSANGGGTTNGGGTATAGGAGGGGGATAGGAGGGSGTAGGASGGGPSANIGTFPRVGMYDVVFAGGADGAMHILFNEGAAERVFYGRCTAVCGNPASWTMVQLASVSTSNTTAIGAEGLALDSTGRLHAIIAGVPASGSANRMVYATCASGCTTAASWTKLDISSVALDSTINTNSTFMVTAAGQVSFLTSGQTGSYLSRYVSCAANCGTLASWSGAGVLDGNPLYARRDDQGVTHILFRAGTTAMGDELHFYGRCASACAQGTSWQISALGFIYRDGGYAAGFAVTPSGKVFLAYNQGAARESTADNNKLFVNSCSGTSCLDLNTWSSFSLGALEEGDNGSTLENDGEELGLATNDQFELKLRTCSASCGAAASWSAPAVIDSATAIAQTLAPDTGSACPGTSQSASWWPNRPAIGSSASGVVVAHVPYAIVKCPQNTNPSRLPTIGRIFSTY